MIHIKKLIRLACISSIMTLAVNNTQAQFCGGMGTIQNPFIICNPQQLDSVRFFLDSNFILANDIDLEQYINDNYPLDGWLPIGDDNTSFTGTLNGAGHKITGLWIDRSTKVYVGLFGYTYNRAIIDSLGVEIDNLKGGIIGESSVGGLIGEATTGTTIKNCYVIGNVNGAGYGGIGGLVGFAGRTTIKNCYATGNISGDDAVGGLVGTAGGTSSIIQSYATGNVNGKTEIGGLVVETSATVNIEDCYATGNVSGTNIVGGLVGVQFNPLTNCYAIGYVTGTGSSVGGLVGQNSGLITNCFFDSTTTKQKKGIGNVVGSGSGIVTALSTAEMFQDTAFINTGWDFTVGTGVWKICKGVNYPNLQWQDIHCNYTVTFIGENVNISPQNVEEGNLVIRPEDPIKEGYDFVGWFTDSGTFANEWDFATYIITSDTTLFAKWIEITSITEIENIKVKIYPNPVKDVLYIGLSSGEKLDYSICDILGQVVTFGTLKGDATINVETLANGLYFLKIAGKTVKIIKN